MQEKMISELILSEPYLAAIGMVVIQSTYLEKHVEVWIWRLCRLSRKQGKVLTGRMSMDFRLDLLSDLAKPRIKDPTRLQSFTKLISDLRQANTDRNVVVHGFWIAKPKLPIGTSGIIEWEATATKERPRSSPLTMSPNQIIEVARRLSSGLLNLATFCGNQWPKLWP